MKIMRPQHQVSVIAIVLILFILLGASNYWFWRFNYRNKLYPQTRLGTIDLSLKSVAEANNLITRKTHALEASGLVFQYNQAIKYETISASESGPEFSRPFFYFDLEKTNEELNKQLNTSFLGHWIKILSPSKKTFIKTFYSIDKNLIETTINKNFSQLITKPENAYFSVSEINNKNTLTINPEKIGQKIDLKDMFIKLDLNLSQLESVIINIKTTADYPEITTKNLEGREKEAQLIIDRGALSLHYVENNNEIKYWRIKPVKLITMARAQDDQLFLDTQKIEEYLKLVVAPEIDRAPLLPRFEIINGKVVSWESGKDGRQLNISKLAEKISEDFKNNLNEVELISESVPASNPDSEFDFNITELIGSGHSAFTGSPANRRHNIKTGAASIHGLLIKPDEEFSLIGALGDIDGKSGYLTELVIKGDKTVPEYGGGLCQLGTTVFRAAISTGLPITMRQNHSYRVSYYEPAGTDATIYDPAPDLRFLNDTGKYILIQTRIEKNDLYVDFWGTKDGRIASSTYPTIYNIVKPEPTKIIETTNLKPGEKKCTESSHNGADAYFDYMVTYPDGSDHENIDQRFKSHYVPWQAVCLVGASSSAATSSIATSSPSSSLNSPSSSPGTITATSATLN